LDSFEKNSPGKKNTPIDKKFSSFVKRVIVELDRDQTLYPEGNVIEVLLNFILNIIYR